jgi:hypothetical protein
MALTVAACVIDQEVTLQEAGRIAAPPPKTGPTPFDISKAEATVRWRHAPEPVSNLQLERAKAKCRAHMAMIPLNSFYIDCMESEGYVAN